MDHFSYRNHALYCEEVPVRTLAETYGTPLWVYSTATLSHHVRQLQQAFADVDTLICYSLKTNPNIHLCRLMADLGTGFDVTSGGELYRALQAGGRGDRIVFAGAGKTDEEMRYGLESGVFLFNVESEAELHALAGVARSLGRQAQLALRVNPALPPKTHTKTDTSVKGTKFGLDIDSVLEFARGVVDSRDVRIVGVHMHLGSPI
ncbi:MAG TPA: diaminopimelate decarboxylase, partial [Gemmataceae bacterium]|nr:diaminopimelate decarboxylase [Gemmataceae bacterium]